MKDIRRCQMCIMPSTRPGQVIDDKGICNACNSYLNRPTYDWGIIKERWSKIVVDAETKRKENNSNWSCLIPVSGGKDSIYQAIRAKESGLKSLCVNVEPLIRTDIGESNMRMLKRLGVDVIEFSANNSIKKAFSKYGLLTVGKINWPEHVLTITVPLQLSISLKIPLVLYGENPENEYGGSERDANMDGFDRDWFDRNAGMSGLNQDKMIALTGVEKDLCGIYKFPEEKTLKKTKIAYLGAYESWDSYQNALVVQAYGFKTYSNACEGSLVNYENLDNPFYGIHDFIKYLKFGFGRSTDQACFNIRRGRLDRQRALDLVAKTEGFFPSSYMGLSLNEILASIGLTEKDFFEIMKRFVNTKLFKTDNKGFPIFDTGGFLLKKEDF
jgi:N-acetyl sugar amidotransferase